MERRLLTPEEQSALPAELPGWALREGRLWRRFDFPDFAAAFGFMAEVAVHAERMNHHPDWSNGYGRVEIELSTHDLGGLSTWDVQLARHISSAAAGRTQRN